MKAHLNTEHKFGLFTTAVVTGIFLCLGASTRQALGAIVIGSALSWALGSRLLALRWAVAVLASIGTAVPVIAMAVDHHIAVRSYTQSIETFHSKLPTYAREHPDLADGVVPHNNNPHAASDALSGWTDVDSEDKNAFTQASRTLDIPNVGNIYFPSNITAKDIAAALRATKDRNKAPNWYLDALDASVDPAQISYLAPAEKPEPANLWAGFTEGLPIELPAFFLAVAFFVSLAIQRRRRAVL